MLTRKMPHLSLAQSCEWEGVWFPTSLTSRALYFACFPVRIVPKNGNHSFLDFKREYGWLLKKAVSGRGFSALLPSLYCKSSLLPEEGPVSIPCSAWDVQTLPAVGTSLFSWDIFVLWIFVKTGAFRDSQTEHLKGEGTEKSQYILKV